MILRVPDYYEEFSCIASRCKDSCCAGWEIDIDEESYEYYRTREGAFGDRLRESMYVAEDGGYRFKLKIMVGFCVLLFTVFLLPNVADFIFKEIKLMVKLFAEGMY